MPTASLVTSPLADAHIDTSGVAARLAALLIEAAESHDVTPCLIARDLNSPVVQALTAALPTLRAHGLAPLLMLAERPDPAHAPRDVVIRTVTLEIASLLREQVIAADFVWCGGPASRREGSADRLFKTLSPTELRAFAVVFQGLWAAAKPLPAAQADQAPAPFSGWRNALAGGAR